MNRKLTREEAIKLHMEMWKDMQAKLGDNPNVEDRIEFKKKWVSEHFPNEYVNSNCFLCEYASSVAIAKDLVLSTCDNCPIAWNYSLHPTCTPNRWSFWERIGVDYRYSPISVILALPEREVEKCHE